MNLTLKNNVLSLPTVVDHWIPWAEVDGVRCQPLEITQEAPGRFVVRFEKILWTWQTQCTQDRLLITSQLHNLSDEAVSLGRLAILDSDGGILSDAKNVRALGLAYSGQQARSVLSVTNPDAPEETQLKFQFYSGDKQVALQVGFVTFHRLMTRVSRSLKDGRICGFTASGDFVGWMLEKGATTPFEEFTIAWDENPLQQLEDWGTLAADRIKPRFSREPALAVTGGHGPYEPLFYGRPDWREAKILDNLDAVNERLPGYGFKILWISQARIPGGHMGLWYGWNEKNFPRGAEPFFREVEKRGFRMGLWNGPFMLSNHLTDLVEELWDAIYKMPDGTPQIFMRAWSHGDAGKLPYEQRPNIYGLDPSHPKSRAFIRDVFAYWREKGVRYYMLDFIRIGAADMDSAPSYSQWDPKMVKAAESFGAMMETIREAAGEETYLLTSSGPIFQCSGFVDAVRTGPDLGESRGINPQSFFYPASHLINKPSNFTGPERCLYNMASWYTHGKLYNNNIGNLLSVGYPYSLEEARISATIHAMSGSDTCLGDSIRSISEQRLALIKKTFPRHDRQAYPEDLFTHKEGRPPRISRYDFEDSSVLAVYNLSDSHESHTLKFPGPFSVWEFWTEKFCGSYRDSFTVEIPAGSVRVFHLVKTVTRPFLLGSDLNVCMGALDTKTKWEGNALHLSVQRYPGDEGALYVYMPIGYYVENTEACYVAKDGTTDEVIVVVPCKMDSQGHWEGSLRFGIYKDPVLPTSQTDDTRFE